MSLYQLYPPENPKRSDESKVDIVAVHGLNPYAKDMKEHAWDTWRVPAGEKGLLWLRDILPEKVPQARIFLYKYEASAAYSKSQETFMDKANELLDSIRIKREDHPDRPLVLMGHSMGGILIEQALINAQANADYQKIYNATASLAFFATPQGGGDRTKVMLGKSAVAIAQCLGFKKGDDIVQVLDRGSIFTDVRKEHWRHQLENYRIVSFWGNKDTAVPRDSSRIGLPGQRERIVQLSADHNGVARFGESEEDKNNLSKVLSSVKDLCNHALFVPKSKEANLKEANLKEADDWIRNEICSAGNLEIERLSGKTWSIDKSYINLSIVEQPGGDIGHVEQRAATQWTNRAALLDRPSEDARDRMIQVKLSEIFRPCKLGDEEKATRRVLIWGRAGVGKTTLSKRIVREFTRQPMNVEYDYWKELFDRVLRVPLRSLKRHHNLEKLFDHEYFRNHPRHEVLANTLWSEVHSTSINKRGNKTLFVLEGLDELSQELDPNNDIFPFLKYLLNQPNVVITSRPYRSFANSLLFSDLELEVIGFHPNQVKAYINKAFTNPNTSETDFQKFDEIQSYLQAHQPIRSLVCNPIQLDAFCYTWSDKLFSDRTLETMTDLYQAVEQQLWRKDVPRLQGLRGQTEIYDRSRSWREIKFLVKDEIFLLQIFAFTGIINNITDFELEDREKLYEYFEIPPKVSSFDNTLASLSFLRTSDASSKRQQDCTYYFIHQTYQEYFAAQYFVQQLKSKQPLDCLTLSSGENERINVKDFLRKERYKARFDILWRFVAGLLASSSHEDLCLFFCMIEEEPRDFLGHVHQRVVMHCLSEVAPQQVIPRFDRLRKDLEGQLSRWVWFECKYQGYSRLANEIEFPAARLGGILQQSPEHVRRLLTGLMDRPSMIPLNTMDLITSWLTDNVDQTMKVSILQMLRNPYTNLPDKTLEAVMLLWKNEDEDEFVRLAAAAILASRPDLPPGIIDKRALVSLLPKTQPETYKDIVRFLENKDQRFTQVIIVVDLDWPIDIMLAFKRHLGQEDQRVEFAGC